MGQTDLQLLDISNEEDLGFGSFISELGPVQVLVGNLNDSSVPSPGKEHVLPNVFHPRNPVSLIGIVSFLSSTIVGHTLLMFGFVELKIFSFLSLPLSSLPHPFLLSL